MAGIEDFIQVALDSTGKKVRNILNTIGANDVEQQVVTRAKSSGTLMDDEATETTLALIKARTDNIPPVGQALAVASTPVVLPAAQITTLTPPAAITGFALAATQTDGTQKAVARGGQKGATNTNADLTHTAEGADHEALDVQLYHGGTAKDPTAVRALTATDVVTGNIHTIAKGTTPAADPTSTASGANHQALDALLYDNAGNVLIGSKTSANSIPVVVASDQAPVGVTPPSLTKGTQGATGFSVQDLKDAGRVNIMWTLEFSPAATAEALMTMTESRDGAAVTTFTTKVVTSGKRLRVTSWAMTVENTLGANPKRAKLRARFNTAGAVTTASPLQANLIASVGGTVNTVGTMAFVDFPDGVEFLGDGTKQIGFTLEFPDWVTAAQTGKVYATVTAFEY